MKKAQFNLNKKNNKIIHINLIDVMMIVCVKKLMHTGRNLQMRVHIHCHGTHTHTYVLYKAQKCIVAIERFAK